MTATDQAGGSTTLNYSITVNPAVTLTPGTLPADTSGVAYNQNLTASGGTGTLNLVVSNIANPIPGLTVPSSGVGSITITGTPTAAGTETFTVTAFDAAGGTTSSNYSITVNPAITLSNLPADTINVAYNQILTASGGTGTLSLAVSNLQNAIPGLTVPGSGTGSLNIAGTPTAAGTETFTVTATDQAGGSTTLNYSITVNPALTLSPGTLPADTIGVAYNQTITSSGGTGTLSLAVTNIVNPIAGLNVPSSGTGSLSTNGKPTAAGTETFSVTATDQAGGSTPVNYSITVNPAVTLNPRTLPADTLGVAYDQSLTASGGTGTLSLAVSDITNPIAGLTVPASGTGSITISGTPTATGTETFTVTATDSLGGTTTTNYSITVNPAITLSNLPTDTINVAYNQNLTASGGTGIVTLTVSNLQNAIPGLTVPTNGTGSLNITGTPTATGTETFTVTATDQAGGTTSTNYSITVNPAVTLSPATLPDDTINVAYNQTITASGGTGTLSLAVSNIVNPIAGLTVPSSGTGSIAISGTPTASGTETFTVTATDSLGATTTTTYSITINPAITLGNLPADTIGVPYDQSITASGGTGTVTLTVSNIQNAIAGLSIPNSGTGSLNLTGTPTATGTETFTVTATDSVGGTTVTNYSITVNPAITLSPATLPADTINVAYNQTITASGGTGTVALAVSNIQNAIAGLNIPSSGTGSLNITGTPTAAGTETFTVTATDALGAATPTNYSITVNPLLKSSTTITTNLGSSSIYNQSVTFYGASWSFTSGSPTPTGTETIYIDNVSQGAQSLSAGVNYVSLTTNTLSIGTHTIFVIYSGDTNYSSSTSATLTFKVNKDLTSNTVTASTTTAVFGQPINLYGADWVYQPGTGTPTGTMTYFVDGSTTGTTLTLGNGGNYTTLLLSNLSVGTHTIQAEYSGDGNFSSSTAASLTITVTRAASSNTLTASAATTVFGQPINLYAAAWVYKPGAGMPTGTMTYFVDGSTTGTTLTLANGSNYTTLPLSNLSVGTHTIQAEYSGDGNFSSSTAAPVTITVTRAASSNTLTSNLTSTTAVVGQSLYFYAAKFLGFIHSWGSAR